MCDMHITKTNFFGEKGYTVLTGRKIKEDNGRTLG